MRNARRNRLLTYHHFEASTVQAFEEQCEHLRRYYTPVTLDDIATFVRDGKPLPRNSVSITVDDGYRDFYQYAYPALKQHRIPATVFLITDFIDRQIWPWWDRVRYAFEHTPLQDVDLCVNGFRFRQSLSAPALRERAGQQFEEALKGLANATRQQLLGQLPQMLDVDIPSSPPRRLEPLTWDEIREMASNGITFGAHTRSHPILSTLETDEELRYEIEGSKARIAEELGEAPLHFSYPNGRPQDITARVRGVVEQAGFRTAVCTEPGLNTPDTDPYLLRRISMDPGAAKLYYRQQVAGFRVESRCEAL